MSASNNIIIIYLFFSNKPDKVKIYCNNYNIHSYTPFSTVIRQADVLSLHCPLTLSTKNLIGKAELKSMKSTAILINTSRGSLVDEQCLIDALIQKDIAAAGFDVFTEEPPPQDNPLIANANLPNLMLTPHVAWGSDSALNNMSHQLVDILESYCRHEIKNQVLATSI